MAIGEIWQITREYDGLAGAGGVKDVSRQLSEALARSKRKVNVVLPLYGFMDPEGLGFKQEKFSLDIAIPYVGFDRRELVRVWSRKGLVDIYLLDAQRFQEKRSVYTYTVEDEAENPLHHQGAAHGDYFAMNILLQKAAIDLMICLKRRPDIIHCHDGHTALLPAMVREKEGYRQYFRNTGIVVTIHNAGIGYHQEVGDLPFAENVTGLPGRVIHENLLGGKFDPFLAASSYAVLNTVSENYARELRETDDDALTGWLGHHLLTKGVALTGVTNGINPEDFNTKKPDELSLAAGYCPKKGDLKGKKTCRKNLIKAIAEKSLGSIDQQGTLSRKYNLPLFTFIGRLTPQKGVDKLIEALRTLLPLDKKFQFLVLGTGAKELEDELIELTRDKNNQGRLCVLRGFDPQLANQIYAAGDFFLIPSRYEPCGLTDYIAQLFGNIPIVHHVGGLVKVRHGETGIAYEEHSSAALMGAMQLALQLYFDQPETMEEIQKKSIRQIDQLYTWDRVMEKYIALYEEALNLAATTT